MTAEQIALRIAAASDPLARLVYADWLEENGKDLAARVYRDEDVSPGAIHHALVRGQLLALVARAKEAYSQRHVSDGYWAQEECAQLESNVGYTRVLIGQLPHPAHREPATIYVRPAKAGTWGKSRAIRKGRPLTRAEMLLQLEAR